MNSEIPHLVVFLDETWVFAIGIEPRILSDGTSQTAKKKRPTASTRYSIVHAGTLNGFVYCSKFNICFRCQVRRLPQSNKCHQMLTQLLSNLEEPSFILMDNSSYHSVLEKPPTQSWRRDKIIAWLQEKRITFSDRAFRA